MTQKRERSNDELIQSSDSPRPKSDGASKGRPTVEAVLSYVNLVARAPETRFEDYPVERSELFQLRDLLYAGPPQGSRKKKKRDPTRASSPVLFPGVPAKSPIRKGQRRQPKEFDTLLGVVASKYYNPREFELSRNVPVEKRPQLLEMKTSKGVPLVGVQRQNTFGSLASPVFRPKPEDNWSPMEIGLFESAICNYGKNFNAIQRNLPNKTTKDVIDFYYLWKKSENYKVWKESYQQTFAAPKE